MGCYGWWGRCDRGARGGRVASGVVVGVVSARNCGVVGLSEISLVCTYAQSGFMGVGARSGS